MVSYARFTMFLNIYRVILLLYSSTLYIRYGSAPYINKEAEIWNYTQSCGFAWHCISLQWRHNEPDGISNHQPHDCLLNRLFRRRPKKTSKLRVTGLCVRNSPLTGEFPAQRASYAEFFSIWWRHHINHIFKMVHGISWPFLYSVYFLLQCNSLLWGFLCVE